MARARQFDLGPGGTPNCKVAAVGVEISNSAVLPCSDGTSAGGNTFECLRHEETVMGLLARDPHPWRSFRSRIPRVYREPASFGYKVLTYIDKRCPAADAGANWFLSPAVPRFPIQYFGLWEPPSADLGHRTSPKGRPNRFTTCNFEIGCGPRLCLRNQSRELPVSADRQK
jgi:hypothetical protein